VAFVGAWWKSPTVSTVDVDVCVPVGAGVPSRSSRSAPAATAPMQRKIAPADLPAVFIVETP
jgi:hypothetical protein